MIDDGEWSQPLLNDCLFSDASSQDAAYFDLPDPENTLDGKLDRFPFDELSPGSLFGDEEVKSERGPSPASSHFSEPLLSTHPDDQLNLASFQNKAQIAPIPPPTTTRTRPSHAADAQTSRASVSHSGVTHKAVALSNVSHSSGPILVKRPRVNFVHNGVKVATSSLDIAPSRAPTYVYNQSPLLVKTEPDEKFEIEDEKIEPIPIKSRYSFGSSSAQVSFVSSSHLSSTNQRAATSSLANHNASLQRPRLLIATIPSGAPGSSSGLQNVTLLKRRSFDSCTPSPPSSDGSSPLFDSAPMLPGFQSSVRSRSKMHELAVQQRLITEHQPRGAGVVQLSNEEKRTLIQEGFQLPTRFPLSKTDEEALKVVRRKIKNKLSAQESRRKRKEYMETLEQRVEGYHSENANLRQRLRQLETNNRTLTVQLRKLQSLVGTSVGSVSISTQTGVCLTALVLMFAVFIPAMPSVLPAGIRIWRNNEMDLHATPIDNHVTAHDDYTTLSKPSRTLLSYDDGDHHCDIPYSPGFFHQEDSNDVYVPERLEDTQEISSDSDTRDVIKDTHVASTDTLDDTRYARAEPRDDARDGHVGRSSETLAEPLIKPQSSWRELNDTPSVSNCGDKVAIGKPCHAENIPRGPSTAEFSIAS